MVRRTDCGEGKPCSTLGGASSSRCSAPRLRGRLRRGRNSLAMPVVGFLHTTTLIGWLPRLLSIPPSIFDHKKRPKIAIFTAKMLA
jgi:hypothetical protein